LSTNFDDHATRDALQTLSELYAASPDSIGGNILPTGESYPGEYAARTRRNLRRDMENKLADGSQAFLKALEEVDQVCCIHSVGEIVLNQTDRRLLTASRNCQSCRTMCRQWSPHVKTRKANSTRRMRPAKSSSNGLGVYGMKGLSI
jgi:hypothetical protein